MSPESETKKEIEAIAHWMPLDWMDYEIIADLVQDEHPQNGAEYDALWTKWEKSYRLGRAMSYLRDLDEQIEELTK